MACRLLATSNLKEYILWVGTRQGGEDARGSAQKQILSLYAALNN